MELVQKASQVRVWGGISIDGKTDLIIYEGSLGAKKYVEILEKAKPSMKPRQNWTFLHTSGHKAKLTNEWLDQNVPNHITSGPTGEWPANSPDLNPMERL